MKYLLLLRHVETVKNVNQDFSANDKNCITLEGKKQAKELAIYISDFIKNKSLNLTQIYTSESIRSINTASLLSSELNLSISIVKGLVSYSLGEMGKLTDQQIENKYPTFYKKLILFKNNLLSSYEVDFPNDAENPFEFEKRVENGMNQLLMDTKEDLTIIILNRSVITAIAILLLRRNGQYPKDFYGFVPVKNGSVTLLEYTNNTWVFHFVNKTVGNNIEKKSS